MRYNRPLILVDDAREDGVDARIAGVAVGEDARARALLPSGVRGGVDSVAHVRAVEVDFRAVGEVVEGRGESEHVPECWAGCGDFVDVEAGVY